MDFFNWNRTRSLMVTLAAMGGTELLRLTFDLSPTITPATVALVWAAYTAGMRSSLVSAILISAYAAYLYHNDTILLVTSIVSLFFISAMVGALKTKAQLADTLDNNILGLVQSLILIRFLKSNWRRLSENVVNVNMGLIEDSIGNISTHAGGWQKLHQQMEEVQAASEHAKEASVSQDTAELMDYLRRSNPSAEPQRIPQDVTVTRPAESDPSPAAALWKEPDAPEADNADAEQA